MSEQVQKPEQDIVNEMKTSIGNPSMLCISFDTTGSMRRAIQQVRNKLRELVEKMTQDIPDIKIALVAHGDYCDGPNKILSLDFTDNLEQIMNFINTTPNTSGGDREECYENVLAYVQSMSWTEAGGSLILIGDADPHEPNDPQNTDKLNWREEVIKLRARNINVFPMQCLRDSHTDVSINQFWDGVAKLADTELLLLENFNNVSDNIEAAAYAGASDEIFEKYKERVKSTTASFSAEVAHNVDKLEIYRSRKKSDLH